MPAPPVLPRRNARASGRIAKAFRQERPGFRESLSPARRARARAPDNPIRPDPTFGCARRVLSVELVSRFALGIRVGSPATNPPPSPSHLAAQQRATGQGPPRAPVREWISSTAIPAVCHIMATEISSSQSIRRPDRHATQNSRKVIAKNIPPLRSAAEFFALHPVSALPEIH